MREEMSTSLETIIYRLIYSKWNSDMYVKEENEIFIELPYAHLHPFCDNDEVRIMDVLIRKETVKWFLG